MSIKTSLTALLLAGGLVLGAMPVKAQDAQPLPAYGENDYVTLTGKVASIGSNDFMLDYGEGQIKVEVGDWPWYDQAEALAVGETVTVTGRVDENLLNIFENKEIDADTVYLHDRSVYYYSTAIPPFPAYTFEDLPEGSRISTTGTVRSITGNEMILDTGTQQVKVDVEDMGYNPFRERQRVSVGDRVFVSGLVDNEFFKEKEIDASRIIVLSQQNRIGTQTKTGTY